MHTSTHLLIKGAVPVSPSSALPPSVEDAANTSPLRLSCSSTGRSQQNFNSLFPTSISSMMSRHAATRGSSPGNSGVHGLPSPDCANSDFRHAFFSTFLGGVEGAGNDDFGETSCFPDLSCFKSLLTSAFWSTLGFGSSSAGRRVGVSGPVGVATWGPSVESVGDRVIVEFHGSVSAICLECNVLEMIILGNHLQFQLTTVALVHARIIITPHGLAPLQHKHWKLAHIPLPRCYAISLDLSALTTVASVTLSQHSSAKISNHGTEQIQC